MNTTSRFASRLAVALACALCATAIAQQQTKPAAAPPPTVTSAATPSSEQQCVAHAEQKLKTCISGCSKDPNKQAACKSACEKSNVDTQATCKQPPKY
jgi:hypothetical protein